MLPAAVQGCGRYGQELNNIAGQALRQTNMLKKKCANRTVKTVRQLKSAPDHSCEAAQKAVEASTAAEEAVNNLAAFAGSLLLLDKSDFKQTMSETVMLQRQASQMRL